MSESAAVIQKSEKLYFLINRRYIALIRENRKTECSGIQQRAVEKEYALVSAGNGRKITGCYKKW